MLRVEQIQVFREHRARMSDGTYRSALAKFARKLDRAVAARAWW
jgi:hypothetical protein